MAGQGNYKRCTYKGCRTKALSAVTSKGDNFCAHHLEVWALREILSMRDFSLALQVYIETRVREALRQATNEATTEAG